MPTPYRTLTAHSPYTHRALTILTVHTHRVLIIHSKSPLTTHGSPLTPHRTLPRFRSHHSPLTLTVRSPLTVHTPQVQKSPKRLAGIIRPYSSTLADFVERVEIDSPLVRNPPPTTYHLHDPTSPHLTSPHPNSPHPNSPRLTSPRLTRCSCSPRYARSFISSTPPSGAHYPSPSLHALRSAMVSYTELRGVTRSDTE